MEDSNPRAVRDEIRPLMLRSDGPGLVRLCVQVVLFIATAALTLRLGAAGHPSWIVGAACCGAALVAFFPSLHESGHGTAFATEAINASVTWVSAVLMLQAPSFFREFHWEHHRETQHPARDPEICRAPRLLDGWPRNPLLWLLLASGQHLMVGKFGFTLACALLPTARAWDLLFPFIRPKVRARVAWESRFVVIVLVGLVAGGLHFVPGFGALLWAWPAAHVFMGLFVMPEHTGLGHDGTQLVRTRTVRSNALVRWWMWNMSFHAEHHEHPAVAFHHAEALHLLLHAPNVAPGYLAFHVEALRRSIGRGAAPASGPGPGESGTGIQT